MILLFGISSSICLYRGAIFVSPRIVDAVASKPDRVRLAKIEILAGGALVDDLARDEGLLVIYCDRIVFVGVASSIELSLERKSMDGPSLMQGRVKSKDGNCELLLYSKRSIVINMWSKFYCADRKRDRSNK